MASGGGASPPSARHGLLRVLFRSSNTSPADRSPLISSPPPCHPRPLPASKKKKKKCGFASAALRRLGCASDAASEAYAPASAVVRSSADCQVKRSRRRAKRKGERRNHGGVDVWCSPGIPFASEGSVDCIASHRPMAARGRPDAGERIPRERQSSSIMDSPSDLDATLFGHDLARSGNLHLLQGYHHTPGWLEEIMMFQTRLLLGRMDAYDQYRDWRLDVDNMSYEELLALGDKIGYVSTGLNEEDIINCIRKVKPSSFSASKRHFSSEIEWKCSICQDEYEVNAEIGELECGHRYHIYCIRQWLLQKNACPVCKTVISRI